MACIGCKLTCLFKWATGYPVLWALWGFVPVPETNPNGSCIDDKDTGGCVPHPCLPTGYLAVLNNTVGSTLTIRWRNHPSGAWTDSLAAFGQGVPVAVSGWQIQCGEEVVLVEVWNGTTKLGDVTLGCGKCRLEV